MLIFSQSFANVFQVFYYFWTSSHLQFYKKKERTEHIRVFPKVDNFANITRIVLVGYTIRSVVESIFS